VLVEPDNDLALAEAMAKTIESGALRTRLIKEGRATVETLFDGDVNIRQLEALFESAAGGADASRNS
jgi:glycosyltransferase involved in cell wall biosynthesis